MAHGARRLHARLSYQLTVTDGSIRVRLGITAVPPALAATEPGDRHGTVTESGGGRIGATDGFLGGGGGVVIIVEVARIGRAAVLTDILQANAGIKIIQRERSSRVDLSALVSAIVSRTTGNPAVACGLLSMGVFADVLPGDLVHRAVAIEMATVDARGSELHVLQPGIGIQTEERLLAFTLAAITHAGGFDRVAIAIIGGAGSNDDRGGDGNGSSLGCANE